MKHRHAFSEEEYELPDMDECPHCGSPAPHLHPAVQFEGEVQTCPHDFHLTRTPQNTPKYIANVIEAQHRRAASRFL